MDERTRNPVDQVAPTLRHPVPDKPGVTVPDKPGIKERRSARLRVGIGLLTVAALGLGIYHLTHRAPTPAPSGRRGAPGGGAQAVGAATAALDNVPVFVNALGTVTPLATVTVQSQISGYLTQVPFKEGQMVHKGDLLAQVDDRAYVALKQQYEGQLAHDKGLLAQAQMDLKRYQTLAAQNSIARQQADDQIYIVEQDEGTVKADQALVDAQKLNIEYCHIVSPVTGRVGLRLVDPGNYVQPNSTTGIAVVTQLQPISVVFTVPEDDLPEIMPQLNTDTKLPVTAFDRASVKKLGTGEVSAVDSQIDTTTGTVKVRAQFDNAERALFPNQFVNVQLLVKTLQNAVTVPAGAVQRGAPGATPGGAMGAYVYLVNADDTVSVRQIKAGPTYVNANNASMATVTSGLKAGDRVVTDGADRLRDGLHVNVSTVDGKEVAPRAQATGGGGGGRRRGRSQRAGSP